MQEDREAEMNELPDLTKGMTMSAHTAPAEIGADSNSSEPSDSDEDIDIDEQVEPELKEDEQEYEFCS